MPIVKVLRPHAKRVGIGLYKVGDTYEESPFAAQEKSQAGFVELVDRVETKQSPEMYDRISVFSQPVLKVKDDEPVVGEPEEELKVVGRTGGWYLLSDGDKVLGKKALADRLGLTLKELEDVDLDNY